MSTFRKEYLFRDTYNALVDARIALSQIFDGDHERLDISELIAATNLVRECLGIVEMLNEQAGCDLTETTAWQHLEEACDAIVEEAERECIEEE